VIIDRFGFCLFDLMDKLGLFICRWRHLDYQISWGK